MNKLEIPAGYRILPRNGIIRKGDKFDCALGWDNCRSSIGKTVDEEFVSNPNTIIITNRPVRIRKPKAKTISKPNIEIPAGYRVLGKDEVIKKGDKCNSGNGHWSPCNRSIGETTKSFFILYSDTIVIRPIPADNSVKVDNIFMCHGYLGTREFGNLAGKAIWLDNMNFNWELKTDSRGIVCLVPTKKT